MICQKKRLLLLGATGMLGSALHQFFLNKNFDIFIVSKTKKNGFQTDLINLEQVTSLFNRVKPHIVVNLAALTNVDQCEDDINLAYLLNAKIVENIVSVTRKYALNTYLIHISTDQVYDKLGFNIEDSVNIKNNYAMTKYAGEIALSGTNSLILRTNFFGRSKVEGRTSISDWVYESLVNQKKIYVFQDIFFSPLSIDTLCEMIYLALEKKIIGLYNLGSSNGMSKADFAFNFSENLNFQSSCMIKCKSSDIDFLKAYRPKGMIMSSSKFERAVGIHMPKLIDEIKLVARSYDEKI